MGATVNMQYFTGHEGRLSEIDHGVDNFRYLADPLDRMQGLQESMRLRLVHRCIDNASADGVESDAFARILDRKRGSDGVQSSLGQDRESGRDAGDRLVGALDARGGPPRRGRGAAGRPSGG